MDTCLNPFARTLNWPRIAALSSTFFLHVAVIVLVASPMAMPLARLVPPDMLAVTFEVTPPPLILPEPPAPIPPPRVLRERRKPATTRAAPSILSAPTITIPAPAPNSAPTATKTPEPAPDQGIGAVAQDTGASRTLGYLGALKPRYPPASLRQREQGSVWLRVLVDAEGTVQRVEIERSSGYPRLDVAAREAVQQARFRALLRDGKAVSSWGIVPIEFRLDRF